MFLQSKKGLGKPFMAPRVGASSVAVRAQRPVAESLLSPTGLVLSQIRSNALEFVDWFDEFDDMPVVDCSREQLVGAILTAPSSLMQGLLYGRLAIGVELAAAGVVQSQGMSGREQILLQSIHDEIEAACLAAPDWAWHFDSVCLLSSARAEIESLMEDAPCEFLRGMLFSYVVHRASAGCPG